MQNYLSVIIVAGVKTMNVYDFDNTIYDGESVLDLFIFYLKKKPELLKEAPWIAKAAFKYKSGKMTLDEALEKYQDRVEKLSETIEDIESNVGIFWDKHCTKIKSFYFKQRKEDDVIVSACLDILIAEVCKRLGIKNYIASETDIVNHKLVSFCFRENKVKAFKAKYPDAVIENFYTDSLNDKPMIDLAQNAYLVKGSKITKIK